jgi:sialic acid synthase SpsE
MTGVNLIEKHFTIDNNLPGRDNKFAILPEELKQLKNYVDRFTAMNHAYKKLLKSDTEIRKVYTGRWG